MIGDLKYDQQEKEVGVYNQGCHNQYFTVSNKLSASRDGTGQA